MPRDADDPTSWERNAATSGPRRRFVPRMAHAVETIPAPVSAARSSCLAVVPAYNEAGTIASVVGALQRKTPQLDVVVIDDGSTDDTAERAQAAGARVLKLPFNLGIGGAVQAGFKYADDHGYDYMVQVDGD